jgi:hypothetical protein
MVAVKPRLVAYPLRSLHVQYGLGIVTSFAQ